jgi:hypothetical protein
VQSYLADIPIDRQGGFVVAGSVIKVRKPSPSVIGWLPISLVSNLVIANCAAKKFHIPFHTDYMIENIVEEK